MGQLQSHLQKQHLIQDEGYDRRESQLLWERGGALVVSVEPSWKQRLPLRLLLEKLMAWQRLQTVHLHELLSATLVLSQVRCPV